MSTRKRTTWANSDRVASPAPATPGYAEYWADSPHPAAQKDPEKDAYKNGDTSSWAEDVHQPPYPNGAPPATPPGEHDHPATKRAHLLLAAAEVKAEKCMAIASSMLRGSKASDKQIERQAFDLMHLTDDAVDQSLERMGGGFLAEDDFEDESFGFEEESFGSMNDPFFNLEDEEGAWEDDVLGSGDFGSFAMEEEEDEGEEAGGQQAFYASLMEEMRGLRAQVEVLSNSSGASKFASDDQKLDEMLRLAADDEEEEDEGEDEKEDNKKLARMLYLAGKKGEDDDEEEEGKKAPPFEKKDDEEGDEEEGKKAPPFEKKDDEDEGKKAGQVPVQVTAAHHAAALQAEAARLQLQAQQIQANLAQPGVATQLQAQIEQSRLAQAQINAAQANQYAQIQQAHNQIVQSGQVASMVPGDFDISFGNPMTDELSSTIQFNDEAHLAQQGLSDPHQAAMQDATFFGGGAPEMDAMTAALSGSDDALLAEVFGDGIQASQQANQGDALRQARMAGNARLASQLAPGPKVGPRAQRPQRRVASQGVRTVGNPGVQGQGGGEIAQLSNLWTSDPDISVHFP